MGFVTLEEAYDHIPWGVLTGCFSKMGYETLSENCVCIIGSQSGVFQWRQGYSLSFILFVTECLGAAEEWTVSTLFP